MKQYSFEVGEADAKSGKARRSIRIAGQTELVAQPVPEVKTAFDILHYGVEKYGADKPLFGHRETLRIVEEEKMVTKMVAGVEKTEKKIWKYFELSDYKWMTYGEVDKATHEIGSGLRKLGLVERSKVTIFASTSPQWMLMAHGCFSQNMVITTAYDTLGEEGLSYSINEADVTTLFTQADLLPVVKHIGSKTPTLKNIIYTGSATQDQVDSIKKAHPHLIIYTLEDLRQLGAANLVPKVRPVPSDTCCIMYTSGTTGNPKGVVLTHANIVASVAGAHSLFKDIFADDEYYLAFLPLAHVLEFVVEHFAMLIGMSLGYGNVRTLSDTSVRNCSGDIRALRPTLMAGVPAVWETIRKGVSSKLAEMSPTGRMVFDMAFNLKWQFMQWGLPTYITDTFIFNKIREQTGGRLKFALSGGAPMAPDTQRFMTVCICQVVQGYGMTESCGASAIQTLDTLGSFGSVGAPFPSVEMKLVEVENSSYTPFPTSPDQNPTGEVWIRGPAVMKGYLRQPQLTKEVLTDDGWLMTGDIGEWKPDGSLTIIDRKKNLVKLSNGEYVALEKLEAQYKTSTFVHNVCVHADPLESYIVALVVPVEKEVRRFATTLPEYGDKASSAELEELVQLPAVNTRVLEDLKSVAKSAGFKPAEVIMSVTILHEEWTPQNGLLTAAQKIKRADITKKFKAELNKMYKK